MMRQTALATVAILGAGVFATTKARAQEECTGTYWAIKASQPTCPPEGRPYYSCPCGGNGYPDCAEPCMRWNWGNCSDDGCPAETCEDTCSLVAPGENSCTGTCGCVPGETRDCVVEGAGSCGEQVCDENRAWSSCTATSSCDEADTDEGDEPDECDNHQGGSSILVSSGEVRARAARADADVSSPSRRLNLQRRYSSHRAMSDALREAGYGSDPAIRSWGSGWYHDFDHVAFLEADNSIAYVFPNGKIERFDPVGGEYVARYHPAMTVTDNGGTIDVRRLDGTLLTFLWMGGSSPIWGRLESITEPSGRVIEMTYYESGAALGCDLGLIPGADQPDYQDRLCVAVARDSAAGSAVAGIWFSEYSSAGVVGSRLTELRYGLGSDSALFSRATRYTYETVSRINQDGDTLSDLTTRLSRADFQMLAGGTPTTLASETYEYTHTSYSRPDLGAGSAYATAQPILIGLGPPEGGSSDDRQRKSVELLRYIIADTGELVEGYEYDAERRGAASLTPGELLRVEYGEIDETERRVEVTNESTGSFVEYQVVNNRIAAVSDDCGCGGAPTASYERIGQTVVARRAIDPDSDPTEPGTRTTYTRDSENRIVVQLDNWEGVPVEPEDIATTVDPLSPVTGPTRVRRFEFQDETTALPRVESRVFSVLCPFGDSFGYDCSGSSTDPRIERTFDSSGTRVDVETSYGLTVAPVTGDIIERVSTRTFDYVSNSTKLAQLDGPGGATTTYVYYMTAGEADPCAQASGNNVGMLKEVWVSGVLVQQLGGYDAEGHLGCSVDENGVETTLTYDADGRLRQRMVQLGGQSRASRYEYRSDGKPTLVRNGEIESQSTYFDAPPADFCDIVDAQTRDACLTAIGRLGKTESVVTATGPDGSAVTAESQDLGYGYDGQQTLVTRRDSTQTVRGRVGFQYDAAGRLYRRDKFISDLGAPAAYREMTHDLAGRLISVQDEGRASPNRGYSYDRLGRLESVTVDAAGTPATTSYRYDSQDNLIRVDDADGRVTEYLYDDFGQLVLIRSPDSGDTRYAYDVAGNLVEKHEAYGTADAVTTVYQYDARSRLSKVFFDVDPANLPSEATQHYHYDVPLQTPTSASCSGGPAEFDPSLTAGRLAAVEHDAGVTHYSYTPFGEIAAVFEQEGPTFAICELAITRYGYDDSGRLTTLTYPSGRVARYIYVVGKLGPDHVELDEPDGQGGFSTKTLVADVTYQVGGASAGYARGSVGFVASWDYAGQAVSRSYSGGAGDDFVWSITVRDSNGNIREATDSATAKQLTLSYDGQDRLSAATSTGLRGYQSCGYTYDLSGNRSTEECYDKTITYGYESSASNELVSLDWGCGGPRDISRDELGRATSVYRRKFPVAGNDDRIGLTYGSFGRLAGVDVDSDGVDDLAYTYDHRGLRRRKAGGQVDTEFTYDASGRLLCEDDSAQTREYVYLNGELLALLIDDDPGAGGAAEVYALGVDHLGTSMRAWNDSGELAWAADYEAFGRAYPYLPKSTASPEIAINVRFPGQYEDEETGLHYNWHRYYDPDTGRYLTPEPLASVVPGWGQPVYAYGLNGPVVYADPNGLLVPPPPPPVIGAGSVGAAAGVGLGLSAGAVALICLTTGSYYDFCDFWFPPEEPDPDPNPDPAPEATPAPSPGPEPKCSPKRQGSCSCQHRDIFSSGGQSCQKLRESGICGGPYKGSGSDAASCQSNARANAPAACRGCLGHCLFKSGS